MEKLGIKLFKKQKKKTSDFKINGISEEYIK